MEAFPVSPVGMSLQLQSRQTSAYNEEWPTGYMNKANAWQGCDLQRNESVELLPVSLCCAGGVSSIHLGRGDSLLQAFIPLNKSSSFGHQCFKHL